MGKTGWAWTWFGFLLALDIAIPWFVLPLVEKWRGELLGMSGAFLFWTIWVVVAIVSAFIIFLKWKEVRQ